MTRAKRSLFLAKVITASEMRFVVWFGFGKYDLAPLLFRHNNNKWLYHEPHGRTSTLSSCSYLHFHRDVVLIKCNAMKWKLFSRVSTNVFLFYEILQAPRYFRTVKCLHFCDINDQHLRTNHVLNEELY